LQARFDEAAAGMRRPSPMKRMPGRSSACAGLFNGPFVDFQLKRPLRHARAQAT
jgi:hypothetical protein